MPVIVKELAMRSVKVLVAVAKRLSVATNVSEGADAAVGVPEIWPVVLLKLKPVGKVPATTQV